MESLKTSDDEWSPMCRRLLLGTFYFLIAFDRGGVDTFRSPALSYRPFLPDIVGSRANASSLRHFWTRFKYASQYHVVKGIALWRLRCPRGQSILRLILIGF